jgi:hypothetical protein
MGRQEGNAMIEVIVRETKEVRIGGRRIKIITEERICSFKKRCNFKMALAKIRDIFLPYSLKDGIPGE